MIWTIDLVTAALGTSSADAPDVFTGVSTDTREVEPGALFVALVGERFDGHDFLASARDQGARAAIVRIGTAPTPGLPHLEVPDTLRALGALGAARRSRFPSGTPVIAITGSSGKTSVKEMIAAVMGERYDVHATRLNENNLVGVPLTLLQTPDEAEAVVVEVGANAPGEVARLRDVVQPTIAVVTNVGPAHLEGLGTVEQVLTEKLALVDGAELAVVGTMPPSLAAAARTRSPTVVAGRDEFADVRTTRWTVLSDGRGHFTYRGTEVTLPVVGVHQVDNALIALAVAEATEVPPRAAAAALRGVEVPSGRMEVLRENGITIVQDCYNANPDSVRAALETFEIMKADRRGVIVLGTMLELGESSPAWHRELAQEVAAARPSVIGAVGAFAAAFEGLEVDAVTTVVTAPDPDALGAALRPLLQGDEIVLLKASRGVALERVLPHLTRP